MGYFSCRPYGGKIHTTFRLKQAMKWHESGKLVIIMGTVCLKKKDKTKTVTGMTDVCTLYKKGWTFTEEGRFPDSHRVGVIKTAPKDPFKRDSTHTRKKVAKLATELEISKSPEPIKKLEKGKVKKLTICRCFDDLEEYARSIGIKNPKIIFLYHGTNVCNFASIVQKGFLREYLRPGMLGRGLYLGKKSKAKGFTSDGMIFRVAVVLGNCKELDDIEHIDDPSNRQYDSLHLKQGTYKRVHGGRLVNDEWVIRDPGLCRIESVEVFSGRPW